MPLSPRAGTVPNISSSSGLRQSAQRRLPPLKQLLQQQQQQQQQIYQQPQHYHHHHHHHPHHHKSTLGTNSSNFKSADVINDSNNNSNGSSIAGLISQYQAPIRVSTSPQHFNSSDVSPGVYVGLSATPTPGSTAPHSYSAGMRGRRPSPRQRLHQHNQTAQQRASDTRGSQRRNVSSALTVKGHSPIQGGSASDIPDGTNPQTLNGTDLTPEVVIQYLQRNSDVLDQYVVGHVTSDRIEKWLHRKTSRGHSQLSVYKMQESVTTNGDQSERSNKALSKWRNKLKTNKSKVLQELAKDTHHANRKLLVLSELAECVAAAISADDFTIFSCDSTNQEITHISKNSSKEIVLGVVERVGQGTSLAASIASNKEPTRLKDLLGDRKHQDGLTVSNTKAQSVLGLPAMDNEDRCLGVVEFYRYDKHSLFTAEEEEVAVLLLQWYDMLLDYLETHNSMIRQRTLSDFLLEVTKSIFQDIVSMDVVIMKIMNFAKALVHADRASLFLLDTRSHELYARIFDDGCSMAESILEEEGGTAAAHSSGDATSDSPKASSADEPGEAQGTQEEEPGSDEEKEKKITDVKRSDWQQQDIRFSMNKGVAGYVASTGKILNIRDAYSDPRFNREVDIRTGYKTKTILCMPIFIKGVVIGVVQMVNKLHGTFTQEDEQAFEMFAIYCGLALHHAKLYEKIRRSEQKYRVALDVLSYHSQATSSEINSLKKRSIPKSIPDITRYDFSPWAVSNDDKSLYVLYMFRELFAGIKYDIEDLMRFTLTVRKNYRNVPYHNWAHAFSVAHSMFTVIMTAKHQLLPVESVALFVACLCHDLDHRGKTNSFMVQSASPLAAIYTTSTMEHHHFNQTVTILQNEGHNIFKYLTSDEYKRVLGDIKQNILATDLAVFFKNKVTLENIITDSKFDWETIHHRNLMSGVMMTACDLCAMFKPWAIQQKLVYVIMEEFWQQGDEEKKRGLTPMLMMDRDKQDELPNLEVGFIQSICVPCYEMMAKVLPDTSPMLTGSQANLAKWQKLAEKLEAKRGTQV